MSDRLLVAEVFGPTIQGEGRNAGRRATFVRLSGCNLACSWCDTPYTWDWKGKNGRAYDPAKESTPMTAADVALRVEGRVTSLLVITGGEPLLQQQGIAALLALYKGDVEIETNGTIAPTLPSHVRYNVSPKLRSSGNVANLPEATFPVDRTTYKFVIASMAGDLAEVRAYVARHGIPKQSVYLMPESRNVEEHDARLPDVAEAAIAAGYNVSPRLHVLIWGNERGR